MHIDEAVSAIENDLLERSKLSYRQLAKSLPILENEEPMVTVSKTEHISLQPFWETPGDLEGDMYKSYIVLHPNFKLTLRESVMNNLMIAAQKLPAGWQLVVKAGFRPLAVQHDLLNELGRQLKLKKPHLSDLEILEHARTFVIDPTVMCPPHCTGAALDVDVVDISTGNAVDMGCPPNTDDETAFTHFSGLSSVQKHNRTKLLEAMFAAGFANLAHEWWHFSYGDQYWAAFYGQPNAIYDIIKQ